MTTPLPQRVDFWFDPGCPFAYATAVWMHDVVRQLGDDAPELVWRPFSLRHQNFPDQAGPWIWERDGDDKIGRGQRGFRLIALVEQQQGNAAAGAMYRAIGAARFDEQLDADAEEVLLPIAARFGLGEAAARAAFVDRGLDGWLAAGHRAGKEEHGVFGVPTLAFDGAHPLFVAMRPAAPDAETIEVFRQVVNFAVAQSYFRELKRAPGPVGAA